MAKVNSISYKSGELTIDPGASGDSFLQFDINGTGEWRIGVDDTDSDAFKISQGSALGSNDTFRVSAAGERTMPLQSAFSAYLSSGVSNVTGDGTSYYIASDTEIFDQNGDYDTSTGIFTAPVTGRYSFMCTVFLQADPGASGGSTFRIELVTTARTYAAASQVTRNGVGGFYGPNGSIAAGKDIVVDMDAADTVRFRIASFGGSKVDDIYGAATPYTCFSGYLVC